MPVLSTASRHNQAALRVGVEHEAAAYPAMCRPTTSGLCPIISDLADYDLAGYSPGARIMVRLIVRGAAPGRAVVAGQGMADLPGTTGRAGPQLRRIFARTDTFPPGPRRAVRRADASQRHRPSRAAR